MHKSLQLVVPFVMLSSLSLSAQESALPSFDGHWEGVIVAVPAEMEADVEIDFTHIGGRLQGRLKFPTQGAKTYEIQSLLLRDHLLSFSVVDDNKIPSFFDGIISQDTTEIKGKMTEKLKNYPFSLRHREPRPAERDLLPPVLRVAADGAELRQAFNAGVGHARLLMTLSPTSFFSRMTLRIVQRYILDQIASSDLKVYIVWEHVFPSDSEQASYAASHLVSDPRVQQFWSNSRFTGHSFGKLSGKESKPVWDSFLIFGGDKKWTDVAPVPDHFRITPQNGLDVRADRRMNGAKLAEEIKAQLDSPQGKPARK
jgi:hypothetical protein